MDGELTEALVEFHPTGSLATTHESQGSDMGLCGGLLGWDATDARLVGSVRAVRDAGIDVRFRITDYPASHPNTYRMTLRGGGREHRMTALSVGGGMIRVTEVDGVELSLEGDCHETLVFLEAGDAVESVRAAVESILSEGGRATAAAGDRPTVVHPDDVLHRPGAGLDLLEIRGQAPLPAGTVSRIRRVPGVRAVRTLPPVLPVLSRRDVEVPFTSAAELLRFAEVQAAAENERPAGGEDPDLHPLWRLAAEYEAARGGITEDEVLARMVEIVDILERSLLDGLAGTEYGDRILPAQAPAFRAAVDGGSLLGADRRRGDLLNTMILYVTAFMEVKSSMGVIVAAPTAGSCGALPGACLAAAHRRAGLGVGEALGSDAAREEAARAMLAAGIVGVFIAADSTFAAEVCGCQAETGAGAAMAAAALVHLGGGSTRQALAASSMALQNTLGMICDPVANRVEVPCLGRNVLGASNALASANMALAGMDPVIPLDEVIVTMYEVGQSLPHTLRCTALGGLSTTPTARRIEAGLGGAEHA
jgi:L-serine dehydratase